jgi:fucose permease
MIFASHLEKGGIFIIMALVGGAVETTRIEESTT